MKIAFALFVDMKVCDHMNVLTIYISYYFILYYSIHYSYKKNVIKCPRFLITWAVEKRYKKSMITFFISYCIHYLLQCDIWNGMERDGSAKEDLQPSGLSAQVIATLNN